MALFHNIFPLINSWLLITAILLALIAVIYSFKNRNGIAIALLILAAFFIRVFVIYLDPFLHEWDEKFQALVARNMMDHPFKPMLLKTPLIPFDSNNWTCNHIWLHKQPLFLWQMALSMKLFGISVFSLRFPSVLMGTITVWLVYRICLLLTRDAKTAFTAALLTCLSLLLLEFISGFQGMDANDTAFVFYILASIWAYAEYLQNKKIKWVVLIGLFAGCAILNKWLTGMLVFSAWGLNILFCIKSKEIRKEIPHFIMSVIICCLVFMPWQLYIFHTFPTGASYEYNFNAKHVFDVVEGHGGDAWYYLVAFCKYFGDYIWYFVIIGIIMLCVMKQYRNRLSFALVVCFLITFCFFSFIVKTKMLGFLLLLVPIGFIFMAITVNKFLNIVLRGKYLYTPVLITMMFVIFNTPQLTQNHDPANTRGNYWYLSDHNTNIYRDLKKYIPANTKVIINTRYFDNIDVMFYQNDLTAYNGCPGKKDIKAIEQKGYKIAAFESHKDYILPDYITSDTSIFIIRQQTMWQ